LQCPLDHPRPGRATAGQRRATASRGPRLRRERRLVVVRCQRGQQSQPRGQRGIRQWQLPSVPKSPPVVGREAAYINCRDGKTYALGGETESPNTVAWTADTGWAAYGIAIARGHVFTAATELTAIDADSGSVAWTHPTGEWEVTAPVYARDTIFVGGDQLYALDPTPGGSTADGPAVRYTRDLGDRVGPGPVIDDGRLYVIAGPEDGQPELIAFDGAA
jgi:outer membrane protein assembly factor BamB